ncbi:MAG TPA: hypothetical protein VF595_01210 [Tepidisphaeraceae bacterium]|jgi:hypothetical protein
MAKQELDLQHEIERLVGDRDGYLVTITLLSGDKYEIDRRTPIVFLPKLVVVLTGSEQEAFFPFEAICNVDVKLI